MNYNWNWGIFFELAPDASGTYLDTLLAGLRWTLATALTAWVVALLLGAVIGTLRTTPLKWVVRLGNAYVELFRNIPLLVQMFLWFFVVPELLPKAAGDWLKQLPNASFWTAVVSLAFFTSARIAEQVRAGINSLPRGQLLAGTALGLTLPQTYRYVLLPMAFRIILPPLTSEFMNVVKNSAVALTIGLMELTARALDAGIQFPGVRGIHCRDAAVSGGQSGDRAGDARGRTLGRRARLCRRQGALRRRRCSTTSTSTSSAARGRR
jgi:glutamate/aspartate transport system permease protein